MVRLVSGLICQMSITDVMVTLRIFVLYYYGRQRHSGCHTSECTLGA